MKIAVLTIAYNEEFLLPHFAKHYSFADIILYDNGSTDNTIELANSLGIQVKDFSRKENDRIEQTALMNTFIKKYKDYDWLIIVDVDEYVYHENLQQVIKDSLGYSVFNLIGYEMFFEGEIKDEITNIKTGIKRELNKPIVVSPKLITETNYGRGRHGWNPEGDIIYAPEKLKLLHYKYIGDVERVVKKNAEYIERTKKQSSRNDHYREDVTRKSWKKLKQIKTKVL